MMMSDVILCEGGHASERTVTDEILALVGVGDCWIADRNFCTYELLFRLLDRRAAFVIRQYGSMEGEAVGPRHARGHCKTGEVFELALALASGDRTQVVRWVTVVIDAPTRDGDRQVHILSSLPAEVSAAQVAALYLSRWTIESAFADLARWLDAQVAPLGYPRAALLGFCVGLMAYNAVSTLLGAMRATRCEDVAREQVSEYYLAQFGRDAVGATRWARWTIWWRWMRRRGGVG